MTLEDISFTLDSLPWSFNPWSCGILSLGWRHLYIPLQDVLQCIAKFINAGAVLVEMTELTDKWTSTLIAKFSHAAIGWRETNEHSASCTTPGEWNEYVLPELCHCDRQGALRSGTRPLASDCFIVPLLLAGCPCEKSWRMHWNLKNYQRAIWRVECVSMDACQRIFGTFAGWFTLPMGSVHINWPHKTRKAWYSKFKDIWGYCHPERFCDHTQW